jgi:arginine decarboxylase
MIINMTKGIGVGPTELAAFDAALNQAGVANYNLLYLSSVIPPDSEIKVHDSRLVDVPGDWGDRLYVVMAEQRTSIPGHEAWAGIGWVQDPTTNRGLFVEHEGASEAGVRSDIEQSLKALMRTRGVDFGDMHMVVNGGTCEGAPLCAMVVAVYEAAAWETRTTGEAGHHV